MSGARLPAHLEAAGILRRAEASGGFATVLRKGDPERGSLLLVISSRGRHVASLERVLSFEGAYAWQAVGPAESASCELEFVAASKMCRKRGSPPGRADRK